MAMIMSVQRLKESGGRERGRERGELGKYLQTRQQRRSVGCKSKLRRTHLVKAGTERERDSLGREGGKEGREDSVCAS